MHEWSMNQFPTHSQSQSNPQIESHNQNPNPEEENPEEEGEEAADHKRPKCEWDFSLSTIISNSTTSRGPVSDTLGAIEFDPSGGLLATGGIARKIRVYDFKTLFIENEEVAVFEHNSACEFCICTPAKLSSLRWKPGSALLGSGDYDGVVTEYDLERRVPVFERDEHGGRRVWSIDYSHWAPVLGGSGSDDGTMQMWDPRCDGGKCVARVQPSAGRSSVCCVEFNPFGGALVAVGCADKKAYGYDVRRMVAPVMVFDGHSRAVSYVRFLDRRTVVTSGTDGCLKMWDTENHDPLRTYKGHVNSRRFVGLSAWRRGGLLACGSESNEVFVYDKRWSEPIWVRRFEPVGEPGCESGFVSSVCWRQEEGEDGCTLVAGGSDGVLQLFEGKIRK